MPKFSFAIVVTDSVFQVKKSHQICSTFDADETEFGSKMYPCNWSGPILAILNGHVHYSKKSNFESHEKKSQGFKSKGHTNSFNVRYKLYSVFFRQCIDKRTSWFWKQTNNVIALRLTQTYKSDIP